MNVALYKEDIRFYGSIAPMERMHWSLAFVIFVIRLAGFLFLVTRISSVVMRFEVREALSARFFSYLSIKIICGLLCASWSDLLFLRRLYIPPSRSTCISWLGEKTIHTLG